MNQNPPEAHSPHPASTTLEVPVIGRGRMRPIWRLLIYLVLIAPLIWLHFLAHAQSADDTTSSAIHYMAASSVAFMEFVTFGWVLLATFIMSRIERRPIGYYGLDSAPGRLRQFLAGLFWGLASLSLLVAALWKLHLLVFNGRLLSGMAIAHHAIVWLGCFLLVAFYEDYFMRGYLQFIFTRVFDSLFDSISNFFTLQLKPTTTAALSFWTAAILLSLLFAAGHGSNAGESPLGLIVAGLAGLIFCLTLWRTGSLWWAIGFHCTWDWAQSFLYGVGDSGGFIEGRLFDTAPVGKPIFSGGATGPEGSILAIPVLMLVVIVIFITLPKPQLPIETEEFPTA